MLPTSENTAYTGATPVKSADLGDIQACIVGHKHAVLPVPFAPGAWQRDGANATLSGSTGQWSFTGASTLTASIDRPFGTRITTIEWTYLHGLSATLTMRLRRRKLDGTAAETVAPSAGSETDSNGSSVETNVVTYNHVMAAGYLYWLQFDSPDAAPLFFGAVMNCDRL